MFLGDVSSDSGKEPDFASTNDPVEEFAKERSPFFVLENPSSPGFVKEYSQDQSECSTLQISEEEGAAFAGKSSMS